MLLALETSDRLCSVCLYDQEAGKVRAVISEDLGRGHAERLIGMIEEVLAKAALDYAALTALAVCVGPGSFTGIRVGLSTAIGFSVALNIPVRGVTSLQALAFNPSRPTLCLIDASRGDVYAQNFTSEGQPKDAPQQIALADVAALEHLNATTLCGSGAALLAAAYPDLVLDIDHSRALPSAENVAKAACVPAQCVAPSPLYLRRPDAKPQEAYTLARALR